MVTERTGALERCSRRRAGGVGTSASLGRRHGESPSAFGLAADALRDRYGKGCPTHLVKRTRAMLSAMNAAAALGDLRFPPGNRLEELRGDRAGQHSVRINDQWRICFMWTDRGPTDVEIVDYH